MNNSGGVLTQILKICIQLGVFWPNVAVLT